MKYLRTTRDHLQERGFTLVEVLVAIAILMIAITGPFYAVQRSITYSYVVRDQLIASSLAQEGAEFVYFVRDNNFLSGANWLTNLTGCMGGNTCTVDPTQSAFALCSQGNCPPLKLSSTGLYTQSGSFPATRFTRSVKITQITSTEIQVLTSVTWTTAHGNYSVNVTEDLYNWL